MGRAYYWLRHVSNHVSGSFARSLQARQVSVAEWAFETGGELPYQPLAHLLRLQLDQEQALTDLLSPIWLAELRTQF